MKMEDVVLDGVVRLLLYCYLNLSSGIEAAYVSTMDNGIGFESRSHMMGTSI